MKGLPVLSAGEQGRFSLESPLFHGNANAREFFRKMLKIEVPLSDF
jgi:hypothetical protein